MTSSTSGQEHTQQAIPEPQLPGSASKPSGPSVNQRMGLAVISLAFLVLLVNITAYLAPSFGPTGSAIALVALCLTVLGINVVFNLEGMRSHQ